MAQTAGLGGPGPIYFSPQHRATTHMTPQIRSCGITPFPKQTTLVYTSAPVAPVPGETTGSAHPGLPHQAPCARATQEHPGATWDTSILAAMSPDATTPHTVSHHIPFGHFGSLGALMLTTTQGLAVT